MLRQKPLVISLALAGLIATTDTNALGLGRLNVTTSLGQPFVAEVDLSIAPGDDFDSIRANIANPAVYRSANVEYQGVLQTIRVQPLRRANGQPFLRLTSSQAINEPYLDVLVEVNSNTGRLVREFVVLLDPQGSAQPQSVEATTNPRATITTQAPVAPTAPMPAPSAAPSPTPSAPTARAPRPAPAPGAASAGSYTVKSGDTLFSIASRNNPGVSIEQLMIAIQRANPNAFIGGNINRLRSGAVLSLPSASEADAVSRNEAVSEVRAQTASWRGYVARVSEGVPTVASDSPQARASGRVSGAVTDTAPSGPSSDKLKLSQGERSTAAAKEDRVAAQKAIKEEQSKAAELAKIKENLEKARTLENQKMAEAQAKAKEAAKAAAPVPAPAPAPTVVAAAPTPAPAPTPVAPPPAPAPAPAAAPVEPPAAPAPAPAPVEPPAPAPAPVAPPPAPPPPVAAKPAPTPAPASDGVMAMVMDNLPTIAAAVGGLAVLGGLLGWSRRRSAAKSLAADSKMSEPVVNTVNPDTVFGTSGLGVVKTNDAPIASQFSRSGMGTIDAGEVDPVAEAEVYIAYGREAQAEEILREALSRDPQRADVATKLAEMAAIQGNREGFDKWVADIAKMDNGADYSAKLAEYASTHFPGHELSSTGVASATAAVAATADNAVEAVKSAGSGVAATGAAAAAAGVGAVAAAASATKDFFSPAPAPSFAPVAAPAPKANDASLDFVLDSAPVTMSPKGPATVMPAAKAVADAASAKKKSLEDDLADLEASLKKATTTGQLPESSMDFTDFSTATPTNLGTVGPAMKPEELDLSFDAARQGTVDPTPSILDGQWHDAATKLDLARAYEEMGDQEGAREILREVIHDGDESQKAEARALLSKLGG